MIQPELFSEAPSLPHGLLYRPEFLAREEEAALLEEIRGLGFRRAKFQQYTALRRVVRFGSESLPSRIPDEESDFPRIAFPPFLLALRERIGAWTGIAPERFEHGLVTEYQPGTPIGWHRDAPNHETVAGVSLANPCRMRFRPMPPRGGKADMSRAIDLVLQPRSLYVMKDDIRWAWQHHIPAVKALRYSITLRTQRPA
jgi:alkylated DNA repair dioxygenase AlkB